MQIPKVVEATVRGTVIEDIVLDFSSHEPYEGI